MPRPKAKPAASTYIPFHRKYRPQTFAEVVGQEPVVQALTHAIEQGRIASAYLFEGVRGTGKTSSARILAKSLNCLSAARPTVTPCGTCEVCRSIAAGNNLDVIEIDAASNTGVENIRRLVEESHLAAMQARYRVWVIDECHKLSSAAMSALLKTLEEPPQKVVFVLATTEPEKILSTILSRCQRYRFGRISLEPMVNHLGWIAAQEGVSIQPDALIRIAQNSGGGLRDAESLLDQVSLLSQPVTVEAVDWITGSVPEQALLDLLTALFSPDLEFDDEPRVRMSAIAQQLQGQGITPTAILEGLTRMVLLVLQSKYTNQPPRLSPVMPHTWTELQRLGREVGVPQLRQVNNLLRATEPQIRQAHQPQIWLESLLSDLIWACSP